jgi:eukaryotic-like serine/threonine-protein kinase
MEQTQWARVKELFGATLELEPSQREAFLRQACGEHGDEGLRAEVESLLAAHDQPGLLSANPWQNDLLKDMQAPKSIGPYELIRKLGEGGMGQVWLAEQTAPVRRQVALKLIRAGLNDEALFQRFQSERQSLAMMDHPAIAKVFEAGSTPEGQPYLVMEYVPGLPITEYCDQKKLTIRERLELFMQACEGVQHAHQKAIIHRDLKPANILVMEVDGKPAPRIIDFGLAKAAVPLPNEKTVFLTRAGSFLGTPGYMSPEQADPDVHDIDTRTDVYSMGVVLYVLLTGFLPFDAKKKSVHEVLRQLREEDPPRPSTRISKNEDKESSTASAAMRGTDPGQLVSLLNGDLDCIAMKALEKDRSRRYGTPSELAADIRHYLNNEPVTARPASAGYRLRKYVRRHRIAVSVAAGFFLLLVGFAAAQAAQLRRITRERDRADRVTDFMSGMFKVSDPSEARGNSITAREVLDKASKDVESGLTQDPELQAQMMDAMGRVYGSLGLYGRAEGLLKNAVDIRRRVLGGENQQTLKSASLLGWTLSEGGHYPEAEKLQRDTLEIQRRILGPEHLDTLESTQNLASTIENQGHRVEAEKMDREVLAIKQRVLGREHPNTLSAMNSLAGALLVLQRYPEAEKLLRETLEINRRVLGPDHPDTLMLIHNLASAVYQQDRYVDAEKFNREALDIERRVLGPQHPKTLKSMNNLSLILKRAGRSGEAEQMLRETIELETQAQGAEHPDTLSTKHNLAVTLRQTKRFSEAEKVDRDVLAGRRHMLGAEHIETLGSQFYLCMDLMEQDRFKDADLLLKDLVSIYGRKLGPDHFNTVTALYNLATAEAREGKRDEAIRDLREVLDRSDPALGDRDIGTDSDFKALHSDPRFRALVAHAKQRAAALQTTAQKTK